MYSWNRKGPCINGGNLTCRGNEVAPNINCRCPRNYKGMFCEEKLENVSIYSSFFAPFLTNRRINSYYLHSEFIKFSFKMCMFFIHNNQVTRICDRTSISLTKGLTSCDLTRMECVTFSRNRRYAYKCQETDASQERRGESRQVTFIKTSLLMYIFICLSIKQPSLLQDYRCALTQKLPHNYLLEPQFTRQRWNLLSLIIVYLHLQI